MYTMIIIIYRTSSACGCFKPNKMWSLQQDISRLGERLTLAYGFKPRQMYVNTTETQIKRLPRSYVYMIDCEILKKAIKEKTDYIVRPLPGITILLL